jgi:hypothetical protein
MNSGSFNKKSMNFAVKEIEKIGFTWVFKAMHEI